MSRDSDVLPLDFDACYRAASGRDVRWDGRIYLGVTSTGIYCRPSCPARKPRPENCRFLPSAAACVAAGFRACKRCRPDAVPGTRDWDARGDLVARAVRRIRDGAIDAVGVAGLAAELAVSERHLRRMLLEEIGASPLQLARTRRAHSARALLEETDLSLAEVSFAAGFGSIRQFGDTMREEFGIPPSRIPRRAPGAVGALQSTESRDPEGPVSDERPTLALRLRTRAPLDVQGLHDYLWAHAVPFRDRIVRAVVDQPLPPSRHALDVPGGTAVVRVDWAAIQHPRVGDRGMVAIPVALELPGLADTLPAIQSVRRMLDLDADPGQVAGALGGDPVLDPLLRARPGLRLAGARNPEEYALGVVLGQQVTLAAARTLQGRLVDRFARPIRGSGAASGEFRGGPDPAAVAAACAPSIRDGLGITTARAETLRALACELDAGLDLGPGGDRAEARARLARITGIGPWTVELIALRGLGDPDAFPSGDLILRRALGLGTAAQADRVAAKWRPFRGYAAQHLWTDFLAETGRKDTP
ncbi:DNA-3-methyladenine glycosylase 2 family protein [Leucobacter luti]|uniref:DNA-3-methyladenine glycosylase 2 family protein n=1 Tax=Leucobacter luti TaxID=340320 RepID=UPI003D051D17